MAMGNSGSEDNLPVQKNPAKKSYEKPAFQFERVFETQALSCGKTISGTGNCTHNRSAS